MAEFGYRAVQADGRAVDGRISAEGREQAMRKLRAQGLSPLSLQALSGAEAKAAPAASVQRSGV